MSRIMEDFLIKTGSKSLERLDKEFNDCIETLKMIVYGYDIHQRHTHMMVANFHVIKRFEKYLNLEGFSTLISREDDCFRIDISW